MIEAILYAYQSKTGVTLLEVAEHSKANERRHKIVEGFSNRAKEKLVRHITNSIDFKHQKDPKTGKIIAETYTSKDNPHDKEKKPKEWLEWERINVGKVKPLENPHDKEKNPKKWLEWQKENMIEIKDPKTGKSTGEWRFKQTVTPKKYTPKGSTISPRRAMLQFLRGEIEEGIIDEKDEESQAYKEVLQDLFERGIISAEHFPTDKELARGKLTEEDVEREVDKLKDKLEWGGI